MFPYEDPIQITPELALPAAEILALLTPFVTDERREKIASVVAHRTYEIVPVVEGLYDRGNVSAVMRSAEALGYQELHIVETTKKFKVANRVAKGTDKWLDVHHWENSTECAKHLKESGYQIVVTHLDSAKPTSRVPPRSFLAMKGRGSHRRR